MAVNSVCGSERFACVSGKMRHGSSRGREWKVSPSRHLFLLLIFPGGVCGERCLEVFGDLLELDPRGAILGLGRHALQGAHDESSQRGGVRLGAQIPLLNGAHDGVLDRIHGGRTSAHTEVVDLGEFGVALSWSGEERTARLAAALRVLDDGGIDELVQGRERVLVGERALEFSLDKEGIVLQCYTDPK